MSNDERGRKLLAAAQEYLDEMSAALARDSWNITVRHAQEVVELAVKGVLCYLCIDYPKVHDAADLLATALTARQMSLSEAEAGDLRAVSSRLAEQRAPAFYFEYDEERATAEIAAHDARRIHQLCLRIVRDLERRQQASESSTEPDSDA